MCGRYLVSMEDEIVEMREIFNEINERYKDSLELGLMKTGEIFPTETAPVLIPDRRKQSAVLMKWGFPKYNGKGVIINARAESASEKGMFLESLKKHRCVIPASGFYEWRTEDGKKTKYLFRPPEGIAYLSGLYKIFSFDNKTCPAYVILTTKANSSLEDYHDRMPLVLDANNVSTWLYDTKSAFELIKSPCKATFEATAAI